MKNRVYHADVQLSSANVVCRLYFPSARMRKIFCLTHTEVAIRCGRRPLIATDSDLERTRMNLAFYDELKDFIPIWDAFVK